MSQSFVWGPRARPRSGPVRAWLRRVLHALGLVQWRCRYCQAVPPPCGDPAPTSAGCPLKLVWRGRRAP